MKTPIEKIVELTRYAPISEEGRIKVAEKIHALYKPQHETVDEIQKLIDDLREGLGYASYDINPIVNAPSNYDLMKKIQSEVIGDLKELTNTAESLNVAFRSMYNPELKPFSEMVNNDVHFRHYYNESMIAMGEDANDKDYERFKEGFIRAKGNGVESINFVFKLADLARSMGYDMDPEEQK